MTLTTRIAIVEPTPVREVFDECRRLLGGEDVPFDHKPLTWNPEVMSYRNHPGQGLHALLWVDYGTDAPLMPDDESQYAEEDRSQWPYSGWSIEVAFDTTYGYQGPSNGSCGDLHAYLVQEIGLWLTDRGLTWYWYHEYTGEWHRSSDPVTILGDPELGRLP